MQVILKDVTGTTYKSDYMTKAQAMTDQGLTERQFDEQVKMIGDIFKKFDKLDHISVRMNGRDVIFNPRNVVFVDVIIDD